ncbi:MAG: DHH family phosphoesterase, partial [Candidatus Aenigmatarchaeota archaeon]
VIILFSDKINEAAKLLLTLSEGKVIRIYSQYDPDGISSAAILSKCLIRLGKKFELRFFKQLNSKSKSYIDTDGKLIVFLDMGSGHLNILKDIIEKNKVFIIDHHEMTEFNSENLIHINPHQFKDEVNPEDYCTSILTFLFAISLDEKNQDLIEFMIYGAIGDRKEDSKIFRELIEKYGRDRILVEKGLKIYGRKKPIHKALAYNSDLFIPEIFGNELAAIQFLRDLGIEVKSGLEWKTLDSLSDNDIRKIVDKLIFYYKNPKDIVGDNFIIVNKDEFFSDVREVVSIINANSRLGFTDFAFRFCLEDRNIFDRAIKNFEEYRKILSFYMSTLNNGKIIEKNNSVFIFDNKEIPDSFVGVLVSMYSFLQRDKPVIGIGYDKEIDMFKVSARNNSNKNINLRNILLTAANEIGGEAGGHKDAAGAYIPVEKIYEFIDRIDKLIGEFNG